MKRNFKYLLYVPVRRIVHFVPKYQSRGAKSHSVLREQVMTKWHCTLFARGRNFLQ